LLDRARASDEEALRTLFGQFLPSGETVVHAQYLGILGAWGLGAHSFGAVTARRAASLRISSLGGMHYTEGALEHVSSAMVFQPSREGLFLYAASLAIAGFLIGLLIHPVVGVLFALVTVILLPLTAMLYFRLRKSGLVLRVRGGSSVYIFVDSGHMALADRLYRQCADLREERLRAVDHVNS
jgi:hypothetical protein